MTCRALLTRLATVAVGLTILASLGACETAQPDRSASRKKGSPAGQDAAIAPAAVAIGNSSAEDNPPWEDMPQPSVFEWPVDPWTYRSPNGRWALYVNPSDRLGRDSATYRMTCDTEIIWTRDLPYTFVNARVTDDGIAAGYGYTNGREGDDPQGPGQLILAILSADGSARMHKGLQRHCAGGHPAGLPFATGLLLAPDNDRCIMRISGAATVSRETWMVFQLSTGQPEPDILVGKYAEMVDIPRMGGHWEIQAAKAIPGTPLILIHWRAGRYLLAGTYFVKEVQRLSLVDAQGRETWSQNLPASPEPSNSSRSELLPDGSEPSAEIISRNQPGKFDVRIQDRIVTFSVRQDTKGKWSVRKVSDQPCTRWPVIDATEWAGQQIREFPELAIKALPPVPLQTGTFQESSRTALIHDFGFDTKGRIYTLQVRRTGQPVVIRLDDQGAVQQEVSIPAQGVEACQMAVIRDDLLLVTTRADKDTLCWRVDTRKGTAVQFSDFSEVAVRSLAGLPDGSFAVVGDLPGLPRGRFAVCYFDAAGRRRWRASQDSLPSSNSETFDPKDVTVDAHGDVLVLDWLDHHVHVFDREGQRREVLRLEDLWREQIHGPGQITFTPGGELLFNDSIHEDAALVTLARRDGTKVRQSRPAYPNGRTISVDDKARMAPDGRIWICDQATLMRLGEEGTADRILGQPIQFVPWQVAIDAQDRLYVVNGIDKGVYVFDRAGALLHVCRPEPADAKHIEDNSVLEVMDEGEVYISAGTKELPSGRVLVEYVRFSPDGKRLGTNVLDHEKFFVLKWCFQRGTPNQWILQREKVFLVSADGRILRDIQRQPDGGWVNYAIPSAVAPDGSLAFLSSRQGSVHRETICLYAANGEPLKAFQVPEFLRSESLAYNGNDIFFLRTDTREVFRIDAAGRPVGRFSLAPDTGQEVKGPLVAAGGNELWFLDTGRMEIARYQIP